MQKKVITLLFLLHYLFVFSQSGSKVGSTNYSLNYSFDYHQLELVDNPRLSIDSVLGINGATDQDYISRRMAVTNSTWSQSYGFEVSHNIYKKLAISTGLKYIKAKQEINPSALTDSLFITLFYDQIAYKKYKTEYKFYELPINLKFNIWSKEPNYTNFLTGGSFFTIGAGLAASLTTHKPYYFHFLEHSTSTRNIGLNGNISFNYHQGIDQDWFFEIGANYRTSLINNYVYAPIYNKYSNYGINFKIGKTFLGKPVKLKSRSILECMTFKKQRDIEIGISAGLTTTFLFGPDTKSDFLPNLSKSIIDPLNIESVDKDLDPFFGQYIGLYANVHLFNRFYLLINPVYTLRGMNWKYNYKMLDGSQEVYNLYTQLKVNLHYFDVPILFNYKRKRHNFQAGIMGSVFLTDRLFEYQISDKFSNNSTENYYAYANQNRALTYFGNKPRDFNWAYILGYQYQFDSWGALSVQVQQTNEIFHSDETNYRFNLFSIKTGVNFYLYKKE